MDQQLPPWSDDPLSMFFRDTEYNERASSLNFARIYVVLQKVHATFQELEKAVAKDNRVELERLVPRFLAIRTHSSFLAGIRLAMSGQLPESYAVLRSAIEQAWYALHIAKDTNPPNRANVWLARDSDKDSKSKCRKEFEVGKVRSTHKLFDCSNRLYRAAWDTLMTYVPVYNDPFEVLKARYREAVSNLGKVDKSKNQSTDRDKKLAEHLMLQYGRGKLELSDDLLMGFWETADDELRGHALDFIGRSLKAEGQELDHVILDRMKALWESRLVKAKSAQDKSKYEKEMSAFAWWFASGRFGDKWSCDQYLEALDIGKKTQADYFVAERLVELVHSQPSEAIQILSKLVLIERPGWIVLGNKEEISNILSTALSSPEENARIAAKDLINRLVSRGYAEFNALLTKNSSRNLNDTSETPMHE